MPSVEEHKARLHAADAVEGVFLLADPVNFVANRSTLCIASPPGALEIAVLILVEVCGRIHPEPLALHESAAVVAAIVADTLIAGRIRANRIRDACDLVPPLDHDAFLIEAVGLTVDIPLEGLLARAAPVLLRVRPEVEPHLLVVLITSAGHFACQMRAPVVIEPAVCVERAVHVRIVARVHKRVFVLEHRTLVADPAGQHSAVLVKGIGLPVNLLPEALPLRAEAFAVRAEIVPGAVPVIAVRILLAVNKDPGIPHHAAVLIHIEVIAAERKDAVL